jgi:pimeloyl-ACP methyl ester carboxylesterase
MRKMPPPEKVPTNGIELSVHRAGPDPRTAERPALVFLHGFPEIAYSWRKQIPYFAECGFPVLAPDQRGFGGSDAPQAVEDYSMEKLTGDIAGLLDHYEIDKAVFIAHDWGALVMWQLPFYQPDRILGLAGLNIPLIPPYPMDPIELLRMRFGEDMYIVRFQEKDAPEKILEANPADTFRFFMRRPSESARKGPAVPFDKAARSLDLLGLLQAGEDHWGGEQLISEESVDVYAGAYAKNGFRGGVNWYRNMTANWQDQKKFLDKDGKLPLVEVPCLVMPGELDRACPPVVSDTMPPLCKEFERIDLHGVGHWSQQEAPEEVNANLMGWLDRHGW